eukprot:gb/GEZN01006951.1/.p1 GENE.gb/GEZN01006951.1/~~gb/GEZN01006951.1/.p1  ORF type:complete len:502 (-),score=33.74 gb/GEZN01006951.1/:29-1534(-)
MYFACILSLFYCRGECLNLSPSQPVQCIVQRSGHVQHCFYHEICYNGSLAVILTDNPTREEQIFGTSFNSFEIRKGARSWSPIWFWQADPENLAPPQQNHHVIGGHHDEPQYIFRTRAWLADTNIAVHTMPSGVPLLFHHQPGRDLSEVKNIFHSGELYFSLMDYISDQSGGQYDGVALPPFVYANLEWKQFLPWQKGFIANTLRVLEKYNPVAPFLANQTYQFFTPRFDSAFGNPHTISYAQHGFFSRSDFFSVAAFGNSHSWKCFPEAVIIGFKQIGTWNSWIPQYEFLKMLFASHGQVWTGSAVQPHKLPVEVIFIERKQRKVINSDDLVRAMNQTSWARVRVIPLLGALTFFQQVQLFATAAIVVAPHGNELANIWFMQMNSAVVELMPPAIMNEGSNMYRLGAQGLGVVYHQVLGNYSAWIAHHSLEDNPCVKTMARIKASQGGGYMYPSGAVDGVTPIACVGMMKSWSFGVAVTDFVAALELTRKQLMLQDDRNA